MVLKNAFVAIICAMLLGWSGPSVADQRRADEFLSLDLSKAVLSPTPFGPVSQFAPVPPDVKAGNGSHTIQLSAQPKTAAGVQAAVRPAAVIARTRVAHFRAEKPRGSVRTKLAGRHGNPLDAQAFDTRVQIWPCRSGGICNWQRPAPAR
jgi:hypothetical protein